VLVTGASGQVGGALQERAPANTQLNTLTRAELDISDDRAVETVLATIRPDVVINAAAYTAVDRAEDEVELARAINARGPANLARAASRIPGCRLLHVSTDYVFDGRAASPYRPDDPPNPLSVYGRTKLEGEVSVRDFLNQRAVVLRTAWVYAPQGKNFLLTMLRLMRERGTVRVVADQRGTPTAAQSIAMALWAIAQRPDIHGILHWTNAGATSWCGFATRIAEDAHTIGLLQTRPEVTPITTAEYPTRAHRPANSVLDISATAKLLGIVPAAWEEDVRATLATIAAAGRRGS
jgi:dTDP-4-dehydrorhamnose reductase